MLLLNFYKRGDCQLFQDILVKRAYWLTAYAVQSNARKLIGSQFNTFRLEHTLCEVC